MLNKNHKKAFTLIEMLIVIVIIGVLAGSLITKLTSVRDRTNDLSRKSDLNQIASAIIAWQMDHYGNLPGTGNRTMNISDISGSLKDAGLEGIPQDPVISNIVSGLGDYGFQSNSGDYAYLKIKKNKISSAAFVLMAKTQTPGASNRLFDQLIAQSLILSGDDVTNLSPCRTISKSTGGNMILNPGGDCYYSSLSQLRYIITR